jgi:hypothetical protein
VLLLEYYVDISEFAWTCNLCYVHDNFKSVTCDMCVDYCFQMDITIRVELHFGIDHAHAEAANIKIKIKSKLKWPQMKAKWATLTSPIAMPQITVNPNLAEAPQFTHEVYVIICNTDMECNNTLLKMGIFTNYLHRTL